VGYGTLGPVSASIKCPAYGTLLTEFGDRIFSVDGDASFARAYGITGLGELAQCGGAKSPSYGVKNKHPPAPITGPTAPG